MATIEHTITFEAASNADANTDYLIQTDIGAAGEWVTVATIDASANPGGSVYTPASVTPESGIDEDDTVLTLPSGSASVIPANSLIRWDHELILTGSLASGASDVYSGCIRGVGPTLRKAHTTVTPVYGVHEEYDLGSVDIGSRKMFRTRVYRIQDSVPSAPSEGLVIYPKARRDTHHTVIWGIAQDENGNPQAGVPITLSATADAYIGNTMEHVLPVPRSYVTDNDGYFEFDAVVSDVVVGTYALTLTIGPSAEGGQAISKTLSYIPDRDYVNFEECV